MSRLVRASRDAFIAIALVLTAAPPGRGAVVVVNGVLVGTPGPPSGGNLNSGTGQYNGLLGLPGYFADGSTGNTFVFNGATVSGGDGGATAGSNAGNVYNGGNAADAVDAVGGGPSPLVTINSGTYSGGAGGAVSGVGSTLTGGAGGAGVGVFGASVLINGGTFQGGVSGPATGTGNLGSAFGGSGVNANSGSVVTITGGTFIGGNSQQGGGAGAGLIGLGGVVGIHGGNFTGAAGAFGPFGIDDYSAAITIYGSNFTFNGVPVGSGVITGGGTLTGKLEDNAAVTSTQVVDRGFGGSVTLAVVPEPALLPVVVGAGLWLLARGRIRCKAE